MLIQPERQSQQWRGLASARAGAIQGSEPADATAHRLHRHKLFTGLRHSRLLALYQFTHRVSVANRHQPAPVLALTGFSWLQLRFLGSTVGASTETGAVQYSLLQTCQVNGIDGYRYLRTLFTALPNAKTVDDYAALLPWRIDLGAS